MTKMMIVSLPVTNMARSVAFYEALGFTSNPAFSNENSTNMVWSDAIHIMLLTHETWAGFTTRHIPPPTQSEVALGLTLDTRDAVDAAHNTAVAMGGVGDINPVQDHGFMYGRDLADPDGHVWGLMWMDAAAIPRAG